jgi:hypothetical protein
MKIEIHEIGEQIVFRVIEREGLSDETLQVMFYTFKEGTWSKGYPRAALMFPQDLARMEANFNAYIENELHQEGRTLADLDTALEWLCTEFERRGVSWWLTGSGALYARGLAVKPHDLDVMLEKSEIEKIREMVTPYIVEPFHHVTGWVVKGFGVVNYRYRIDFAFEPEDWVDSQGPVDFGPYARERVEPLNWHGHQILVPPVELQIAPNESRGRNERVELIRQYLRQQDFNH